jgi:hypothetical protein
MRDMDELFVALGRSKFRSGFKLTGKEAAYLRDKGMDTILQHTRDFVIKRLANANPANDGKQTPMRNHPVFIAQHATGTCCRGCLAKWHYISKGSQLTQEQIDYIIHVLKHWLAGQNILQQAPSPE